MNIESISLKNFRVIKQADIELNGKNTVLFGVNGVGKSTILHAANILFAGLLHDVNSARPWGNVSLQKTDIAFGNTTCEVKGNFILEDQSIIPYKQAIDDKKTHVDDDMKSLPQKFRTLFLKNERANMPIFCSYFVDRQVSDIAPQKSLHQYDKLSALEHTLESRVDFNQFFTWLLNRKSREIDVQKENPGFSDNQLDVVRMAIMSMIDDIVDLEFYAESPYITVKKDDMVLAFDQLSDGEKCMLSLFGDIARRLVIANPTAVNPLHGKGIILIDEIELHMHTTWQRRVLSVLHEIFPYIQFIITTHSPQVLGEIGENYHIYAVIGDAKNVTFMPVDSLKGWDSNYILEEFMGTPHMNEETKTMIVNMNDCILENRLDEAEKYADKLEKLTDSANSEVVKARILIARGRRRS